MADPIRLLNLLRHVEGVTLDPKACWLWRGARKGADDKYGNFNVGGRTATAHHAMFELVVGPVPKGMEVCHTCDVPLCVNPRHLFLGTRLMNMRDAARKGRISRGEKHSNAILTGVRIPGAKLTPDQVREIVARLNGGQDPQTIAETFDVSRSTILCIRRGAIWSHVTGIGREVA